MGQRGPLPSSGVVYVARDGTQLDVVIRAHGAPYVYWPKHPLATSSGHVPVIRLSASEALGRWVTRGEAVQPIDGDPWNWSPSNLQVRPLAASLPRPLPKVSRSAKPGAASPRRALKPPKAPKVRTP